MVWKSRNNIVAHFAHFRLFHFNVFSWLQKLGNGDIISLCSGRGAARLARLHGVQEVEGSNPFAPTKKNRRSLEVCGLLFEQELPLLQKFKGG